MKNKLITIVAIVLVGIAAGYLLGKDIPSSGNLERWADQGVLLLNATLTVKAQSPGSHQNKGWEQFTNAVIEIISEGEELEVEDKPIDTPESLFVRDSAGNRIYRADLVDSIIIRDPR